MAIIATVTAPEQWLIEVNGSYDLCFEEVTLTTDRVDGEVTGKGIISGGGSAGDTVRVMVRGNPSLVRESMLTGTTSGLDESIVLI